MTLPPGGDPAPNRRADSSETGLRRAGSLSHCEAVFSGSDYSLHGPAVLGWGLGVSVWGTQWGISRVRQKVQSRRCVDVLIGQLFAAR